MFYRNEPIQIIGFGFESDDEKEIFKAHLEGLETFTKFNEKMKRDNRLKEQEKEIIDLKIENLELQKRVLELEGNNE